MGTKATSPKGGATSNAPQASSVEESKPSLLAREYRRKPSSSSISIMHNAFKGLIASDE
jgi:hypothetical protein